MNSGFRVGVLSTYRQPFIGRLLRACVSHGVAVNAVFLDEKDLGQKESAIYQERTEGRLPPESLYSLPGLALPYYMVESHNSKKCVDLVAELELDLLVNMGTPRRIGTELLQASKSGILNCHPGLLPNYRGCCCVEWAIFNDDPIGNTVHFMDAEFDRGPIVLQEQLNFSVNDDYVDIRCKVYLNWIELLARACALVSRTGLSAQALPTQSEGKYYPVMSGEDIEAVKRKVAAGQYAFQR
jgi:methionyl-tRNA formyltransferase